MIELNNYKIDENRIIAATTDEESISKVDSNLKIVSERVIYILYVYITDRQIEEEDPWRITYDSKEQRDKDYAKIAPHTYEVQMRDGR